MLEVTPVSLVGRIVGTLLGLAIIGVGIFLARRHRPESESSSGFDQFTASIQMAARWRVPNAILIIVNGLLFTTGVWVNPRSQTVLFIGVWVGVLLVTTVIICVAVYDLMYVRRQAIEGRKQLVQQNRKDLEDDLREYFRSKSHKGNGSPPHEGYFT